MLPLIALATTTITGSFTFRYVLASVIGSSILCGIGIDRLARRSPAIGLLFIACTARVAVHQPAWSLFPRRVEGMPPMSARMRQVARSAPVVVTDPHFFLTKCEKGRSSLSSHLLYIADPTQAKRFGLPTTPDPVLLKLGA